MIDNRKDARAALFTLLETALTSASAGYPYARHDFGGQSPVFYLSSSGTNPKWLTGKGWQNTFFINVHLLTLYAANDTYTEQTAEDTLDDLEHELRMALAANKRTDHWQHIEWADRSRADDPLQVGGDVYLHEIVSLAVEGF